MDEATPPSVGGSRLSRLPPRPEQQAGKPATTGKLPLTEPHWAEARHHHVSQHSRLTSVHNSDTESRSLVVAGFPACLPALRGRLESLLPPSLLISVHSYARM